jgi:hypothetical protein
MVRPHEFDSALGDSFLKRFVELTDFVFGPLALLPRADRRYAVRHVVGQIRVLLDRALIECIGLFGVESERAERFAVRQQGKGNFSSFSSR